MQKVVFVILIYTSLSLCSCGGTTGPSLFTTPFKASPEFVKKEIATDLAAINEFEGEATITIDSPEQSGKVRGDVSISPPEEAYINLKHPFGGILGTLEFKENYLVFYDAKGNVQFIGTTEETGIPGLPRIISGNQNVTHVFLGLINLPMDSTIILQQDSLGEELYHLEYKSDYISREYQVDPKLRKVVKYTETDLLTGLNTTIDISNFTEIQGINIPKSITVTQQASRRMFSIFYHKIQIALQKVKNAS